MTVNINQFAQTTVRGALDLQISKSGVITGKVSSTQATLKAGDRVQLDSANTGPVPLFVLTDDDSVGIGAVIHNTKQDSFVAGDDIEIAGSFGPVMWLNAGATILPGAAVEDVTDGSGTVITKASHVQRGIALDYATSGQLLRVILTNPIA